ncbi:helix-turn-helix transcriptional regulator [Undibacterium sp. WLX3042]|uniref:helix-turn-helix transcriptional regulator n=1 Tax=Undibacterium sp. WLX3042 TaxID=3412686 RepID=UPI003C2AD66F
MQNFSHPQLLRRQQVELMTGLKRSSIYGRMNPQCKQYDPSFPKPVSLSVAGKGSVAWIASEVDAWIAGRIAASRLCSHGSN